MQTARMDPMRGDERTSASRNERFRALFETNYPKILGYARRRASAEDAADVAAETFSIAWRRLEDVPQGDAALLWLYGAARRVLANLRRSQERRLRLDQRVRANGAITYDQSIDLLHGDALDRTIADAFSRLGHADQDVLGLIAWEELDAASVAVTLGCSPNAARIRIHRARRRFMRELHALRAPQRLSAHNDDFELERN
jgi:RNA polymerase sigma-70 factor (ECF subfamily)